MMKNKKLQKHIAEWCVQGMCHDWHCTPQFPSLTLLTLNTGWCCCPATWAGCRLQLSVHHRACAMVLLLCIINSRFKVQSECQSKPRSYILYHSCKGAWESESYNSSSKSQSQETFWDRDLSAGLLGNGPRNSCRKVREARGRWKSWTENQLSQSTQWISRELWSWNVPLDLPQICPKLRQRA